MTSRFRTRAFLICFIPFALLLAASFWIIQSFVQSTVRDGLQTSLHQSQIAVARMHARGDLQNNRFLKVAGENTALKAGMQLLLAHPHSVEARNTVEDQLRELGEHMGFDFMLVSGPNGSPLAGVVRDAAENSQAQGQLIPLALSLLDRNHSGFLLLLGRTFQVASVPVDEGDENLGILSVGGYFNISDLTAQVALVHDGEVLSSNLPNISFEELRRALAGCKGLAECDLRLQGDNWISLPMESYGNGFLLLSFENIDAATTPIQSKLQKLFVGLAIVCVLVALICSVCSSSSIVKPIAAIVSHLRSAARTGKLAQFEGRPSSILEIQELAELFNRAAVSVRAAGENLEGAYLEFVGSLANALDARDQYTAGHSGRVSRLSCATAAALDLGPEEVERIRIGALLHDVGKIGVADGILQKPGRLTEKEFAIVKQHPVIGRRILEGVQGFAPYLAAVELHHENWDGTGYPHGQSGEQTPIEARIIHVSDAYDAMTTNRTYRRGMTIERATSILIENAGTQFDPRVVDVFVNLPREILTKDMAAPLTPDQMEQLVEVAQ